MPERDKGRIYYLDGLRGWAALMVVFSHTFQTWLLSPTPPALKAFVKYSPICVAMDGPLAVNIFFVISGFALSYPILVSANRTETLLKMALFRYPRLVIPILISSILVFLSWGMMANVEADRISNTAGWLATFYRFKPTWSGVLSFSTYNVFFHYDSTLSWNSSLWTMHTELIGSILIFSFLLFVRIRSIRIALAAAFAIYFHASPFFGFATGYLIADLLYIPGRCAERTGLTLVVIAIAAAAWNSGSLTLSETGYNLIATATVAAAAISPSIREVLSCRASRFMGRISFSLYLVHVPIICTVASLLYILVEPSLGFIGAAAIVGMAVVATSIVVALAFNRLVEETILPPMKLLISKAVQFILIKPSSEAGELERPIPMLEPAPVLSEVDR
jgi:peptidoglycan/LPS O-acetylase OafA/YrhL